MAMAVKLLNTEVIDEIGSNYVFYHPQAKACTKIGFKATMESNSTDLHRRRWIGQWWFELRWKSRQTELPKCSICLDIQYSSRTQNRGRLLRSTRKRQPEKSTLVAKGAVAHVITKLKRVIRTIEVRAPTRSRNQTRHANIFRYIYCTPLPQSSLLGRRWDSLTGCDWLQSLDKSLMRVSDWRYHALHLARRFWCQTLQQK